MIISEKSEKKKMKYLTNFSKCNTYQQNIHELDPELLCLVVQRLHETFLALANQQCLLVGYQMDPERIERSYGHKVI